MKLRTPLDASALRPPTNPCTPCAKPTAGPSWSPSPAPCPQFPKETEGTVVRMIHHSTSKQDELLTSIYDAFKPAPGSSDKENETETRRDQHPLGSKLAIKTFLTEVRGSCELL